MPPSTAAKTRRRARKEESDLLATREPALASGPLVELSEELLFSVLACCNGATLGRVEMSCRLFGRRPEAAVAAAAASRESLPERVAAFSLEQLGLGAPSLWARATGASRKHQLWRTQAPASRLRRFPVRLPLPGGSPAFGPHGELWMADYMGKCVTRIGWNESPAGGGAFEVTQTFRMPAVMRSTAAAVAVSSDGLRLAITVQPPYFQDGHGSHGFLILCARTGATLASYLDGDMPGIGVEDELEYPSAVEWLRGGSYAGQLAVADYNNGRVQIRNADTGALSCTVALEDSCVSGCAELAGDSLAVVPHFSDAVAVFDLGAIARDRAHETDRPKAGNHARWFGRGECGMPIAARGVDDGQTLAVSDGAHRCVLFFENVAAAASDGRLCARRSRAKKNVVSVAVDYASGEVVEGKDRPRPREFGRRPLRQWRRLRVDVVEHEGEMSSDDEDFNPASLYEEEDGDEGDGGDGAEDSDVEDEDEDDDDEDDEEEEEDADDEGEAAEEEESGSEDSDEDSDEDFAWGQFGIWTSLGFDRKRGDMVVSDSGTRYSKGSVWIS